MYKILLLEDNTTDIEFISREIKDYWPDADLTVVSRITEAKKLLLGKNLFDVALFDINLPDGSGLDLLSEIRSKDINLPIIILTGTGSEDIALSSLKAGASDYISKKAGFQKLIPKQIVSTLEYVQKSRQSLRVLYVEHHKSDIDLTLRHFKKHAPHIKFNIVPSGNEALGLLPETPETPCDYDVLLLDYQLPGLNALEISKIIVQERNLSIAIVITTGHGDEAVAVEALKVGVDDYIVKHESYLSRLPSVITSAYQHKELERKQELLKQSETKFRLLADYAFDWEYWMNPEGEYIYISPVCEQISGYKPQEFIKNKDFITEITHPEYREFVAQHFAKRFEQLQKPIEFIINTADGKEKWISHIYRTVYDENNVYLGKRGVNRDITERKKADLELRKSEERFKRLFEDLGDAVYVTKIGKTNMGDILEVNAAAIKQSGYSREELLKMNIIHDLSVRESSNEISSEDSDSKLISGKTVSYIERKRRKNGEEYWTEILITPIEFNGNLAGLSINRDITERKRSESIQQVILNISTATQTASSLEETMKIIQTELGRLMDTKNFFVALYNEETDRIHLPYFEDDKGIIDFPAGKTLAGLVIKEGKSLLINPTDAKKLEQEKKIEKVGFDSEIWLGVPLRIKGKITGAFVVQSYTDPNAYNEKDKEVLEIISHQISISIERKREEEKLLMALEAAKESDRIKTAFLANMSHELRTPLNAVIGFSDLIDDKTEPSDSADFAQLIYKSGINLLSIVDDIFEITLIEQGQLYINRSQKPLSSFLNDIYQTALHRQKNQGASKVIIEQELRGIDQQTLAFTDFTKLTQVFLSLLNNALKFTPEGLIRFGVYPSENGKDFVFFVEDSGIGIPKEKHENIFERFKIGDDTLTRKYSGIGAGLYISSKLIQLLGGKIWVESEDGKGSVFYFTIPK